MIESATIRLDDVEIFMTIGLHDHEKAAPQRYLISAGVAVDPATVSRDGFFDYDPLMDFLNRLSETAIETHEEVALKIWNFLRTDDRVVALSLKLRKPDVFSNASGVGLDVDFKKDP